MEYILYFGLPGVMVQVPWCFGWQSVAPVQPGSLCGQ